MDKQRINYLYKQYTANALSLEELDELVVLVGSPDYHEQFKPVFEALWNEANDVQLSPIPKVAEERIYQQIVGHTQTKKFRPWIRIAAAAAILILIGTGILFYNYSSTNGAPTMAYANDIAPGKVGATLLLSNGKRIALSSIQNGELGMEGGLGISKTADGRIVYETKNQAQINGAKTNTLFTAKGETYQVRLPDGSLVTLNAASQLTYSTALNEKGERRVRLSGEAYFEVFKDKKHPFVVESEGQVVEVLGTHFNINTYKDEETVKTTLLEGSIKINQNTVLKPGEQAALNNNKIVIQQVDPESIIAWQRGKFVFVDEELGTIMKKIARWYDVEIRYEDADIEKETFWGSISSFENVSDVLKMLELTKKVHFKIEGRRIIVLKK